MSTGTQVPWPTVIIGGAPRSGTSTVHDWLNGTGSFRRHPRKELFLLNDPGFWIRGATPGYAEAGERCFELAGFRREERFVDASTTYLYQRTAPAACARWLTERPDHPLVVVFCLREPAERLYSNFHYFRDVLLRIPARTPFGAYVDALFDGTLRTGNQQVDQALEHGLYPVHLGRWQAAVGTERIIMVRTEELADGPQAILSQIAARTGIPLSSAADVRKNRSYRPRSRLVQTLARFAGAIIPRSPLRERLKSGYVRMIAESGPAVVPPDDESALERVRGHYREHRAAFAACGLDWYGTA